MTETLHPRLRRGALLALALIPALALAVPAWAKKKERPPSAQASACGGVASPHLQAGLIDGKPIATFFGEKLRDWSINQVLDIGFIKIAQLTGLDSIIGGDQSSEILDELHTIEGELNTISDQLMGMQKFNSDLYGELKDFEVKLAVDRLCQIKVIVEHTFNVFYLDWVQKGVDYGNALRAVGLANTQQNRAARDLARTDMENAKQLFIERLTNNNEHVDYSKEIHQILVPGTDASTSLPTTYGQVLMGKHRYLTSADTDALRQIYDEFAQVEELATWMAAEWFQAKGSKRDADLMMHEYVAQQAFELGSLPKPIPEGVVIDLGSDKGTRLTGNVHNKPIWFVPSIDALCWQPSQTSTFVFPRSGTVFPPCDEVGAVMAALNAPHPDNVLGPGWGVPSMVQLTALLSEQCLANPADPTKFSAGNAKCSSPLGGNGSNTVRDSLAKLNPTLPWQLAFCDPKGDPGCPEKNHVWAQDFKTQRFRCGREGFFPWGYTARDYRMRTGYYLSATNTNDLAGIGHGSWWSDDSNGTNVPGLPRLPKDFPGYDGDTTDLISHEECDRYVWEMYFGALPGQTGKIYFRTPSPLRRGALIATRYTGEFDLWLAPQVGTIDYMAQTVKP